ncbi:MAG TPA: OB-fold nucleic acid binding domain-containing protein [Mycobacteriales bacterium]|nr:OB-fold nucleic acid binding domain-containing protein [Mycobacteriales bacterium]
MATRAANDRDQAKNAGDGRGWLARCVRRLVADDADLDAEELRSDAQEAGATSVSECCQGQEVTVTGRLKTVVLSPRGAVPALEADLFDGSGSVKLVWLGRRQITGIEPGRMLAARGRVAERDGCRIMFNPWYELKQ